VGFKRVQPVKSSVAVSADSARVLLARGRKRIVDLWEQRCHNSGHPAQTFFTTSIPGGSKDAEAAAKEFPRSILRDPHASFPRAFRKSGINFETAGRGEASASPRRVSFHSLDQTPKYTFPLLFDRFIARAQSGDCVT